MRKGEDGNGHPRCTYCGVRISRKAFHAAPDDPIQFFTMDHISPASLGGANHNENLVPACQPCNKERGDKPLDQFIESLGDKAVISVEEARALMRQGERITRAIRGERW